MTKNYRKKGLENAGKHGGKCTVQTLGVECLVDAQVATQPVSKMAEPIRFADPVEAYRNRHERAREVRFHGD
jgi:hypothetical protein